MSVTTLVETRVPFLDLKAQYVSIREEADDAVLAVLESGHFVGGHWVEKFEHEFAQYVGAKYALGVGSGTAALELALQAAGIRAGDEVIVPANSFFATAEAVSNVGAKPVFADVNPMTYHLEPSTVEPHITAKTRAIIPVHLYGRAADLTGIERLAEAHNLLLIEDACQAHGVGRRGVRIGGAGRLTCFSFYPGKNLGAYGDGGAITCNDQQYAQKIRILRDHGSPAKYQHEVIGTNSRLDAVQAAVLSVKLRYLDNWNSLRVRHAEVLAHALGGPGLHPPSLPPEGEHNFHLFVVRARKRDSLRNFLKEQGIETGIHYPVPLHLTPAYEKLGYPGRGSMPVTEALADEILSLPMCPELTKEQLDYLVSAVREFTGSNGSHGSHSQYAASAS
ncbi:MAG: DegT/DnrJ/EryC1/StrS family aminotransferase [Acidobacteriia bacterium]|nr:DegT/DnrJ/EryC1/StrS family aminotransferase [Terriglobia bacterium]